MNTKEPFNNEEIITKIYKDFKAISSDELCQKLDCCKSQLIDASLWIDGFHLQPEKHKSPEYSLYEKLYEVLISSGAAAYHASERIKKLEDFIEMIES